MNILIVLIFLLAPAAVLGLCRKIPVLGKIGPVLILYGLGMLIGNIFHPEGMAKIQDILSSATVPLAIPLMLFSCTFSRSQTRSQFLAMLTGMAAVIVAVVAGFFIFGRNIDQGAKIGGMLTGVYTGGTINLAALKVMLGVNDETFVFLNSCDMAVSFLYITLLLSFGIKLARKWLPSDMPTGNAAESGDKTSFSYSSLLTGKGFRSAAILLGIDAVIIGISAGLGLLAGDSWFMTVLILCLTTLGIAASFCKRLRELPGSYDLGMYLIYIFSIVVASMADFSNIHLSDSLGILGYLTFVIFGSLMLQFLLSKIFKVDADMTVVSSVTYICSPPFVPMMTAAMKNRSVLAGGLAIGVIGYAAGNYLGFLLAKLLELL